MSTINYSLLDDKMTTKDDKIFYRELGQRVAQLRKEQSLTQVQLAKILKISQQNVAAYEAGLRKIPVSVLPKLSKLFGVSFEDLLGAEEKKTKRGPTPKFQRQIEKIAELPRAKQKFVMEMLNAVLQQNNAATG